MRIIGTLFRPSRRLKVRHLPIAATCLTQRSLYNRQHKAYLASGLAASSFKPAAMESKNQKTRRLGLLPPYKI